MCCIKLISGIAGIEAGTVCNDSNALRKSSASLDAFKLKHYFSTNQTRNKSNRLLLLLLAWFIKLLIGPKGRGLVSFHTARDQNAYLKLCETLPGVSRSSTWIVYTSALQSDTKVLRSSCGDAKFYLFHLNPLSNMVG